MSNVAIAKIAAQFITSVSVSKVISDVIRSNTNVETTADAVKVATGSLVLGSLIADAASSHVNGRIDSVVAWYQGRKNETVTES